MGILANAAQRVTRSRVVTIFFWRRLHRVEARCPTLDHWGTGTRWWCCDRVKGSREGEDLLRRREDGGRSVNVRW